MQLYVKFLILFTPEHGSHPKNAFPDTILQAILSLQAVDASFNATRPAQLTSTEQLPAVNATLFGHEACTPGSA
jgi:hypothetical protein